MSLTWLYVPGDRPDRFAKAVASGADVVILDLGMPVMDGREALGPILREVSPPPRVVILTMHGGTGQRRELLVMGASAFLAKSASLQEILAVVKGANPYGGGTRRA